MNFQYKNGCKGQICDGSISIKLCHKEYNLYEKFHNLIVSKIAQLSHYAALLWLNIDQNYTLMKLSVQSENTTPNPIDC